VPDGLQAWNAGEGLHAQVTGSPQLLQKLGQSELNIALQAEALGAVQVRTHVSGDQVGAAITVERHDVHALLSSDLPALHQALGERQLRLENISLQQAPLSHSGGTGPGDSAARQQSQDGAPARALSSTAATTGFPASPAANGYETPAASGSAPIFDSQGRLSVRA
jgi:flagellar hook-length control protein FliK